MQMLGSLKHRVGAVSSERPGFRHTTSTAYDHVCPFPCPSSTTLQLKGPLCRKSRTATKHDAYIIRHACRCIRCGKDRLSLENLTNHSLQYHPASCRQPPSPLASRRRNKQLPHRQSVEPPLQPLSSPARETRGTHSEHVDNRRMCTASATKGDVLK